MPSEVLETYPIPSIKAQTVTERVVMEFVARLEVPHHIKTDRGRQFEYKLFREMCRLLETEHIMSTPFHRQGNSRVERMVKMVGNSFYSFCHDYKEWGVNLPLLTSAYQSTVHEVTGLTPNHIMTGERCVT